MYLIFLLFIIILFLLWLFFSQAGKITSSEIEGFLNFASKDDEEVVIKLLDRIESVKENIFEIKNMANYITAENIFISKNKYQYYIRWINYCSRFDENFISAILDQKLDTEFLDLLYQHCTFNKAIISDQLTVIKNIFNESSNNKLKFFFHILKYNSFNDKVIFIEIVNFFKKNNTIVFSADVIDDAFLDLVGSLPQDKNSILNYIIMLLLLIDYSQDDKKYFHLYELIVNKFSYEFMDYFILDDKTKKLFYQSIMKFLVNEKHTVLTFNLMNIFLKKTYDSFCIDNYEIFLGFCYNNLSNIKNIDSIFIYYDLNAFLWVMLALKNNFVGIQDFNNILNVYLPPDSMMSNSSLQNQILFCLIKDNKITNSQKVTDYLYSLYENNNFFGYGILSKILISFDFLIVQDKYLDMYFFIYKEYKIKILKQIVNALNFEKNIEYCKYFLDKKFLDKDNIFNIYVNVLYLFLTSNFDGLQSYFVFSSKTIGNNLCDKPLLVFLQNNVNFFKSIYSFFVKDYTIPQSLRENFEHFLIVSYWDKPHFCKDIFQEYKNSKCTSDYFKAKVELLPK